MHIQDVLCAWQMHNLSVGTDVKHGWPDTNKKKEKKTWAKSCVDTGYAPSMIPLFYPCAHTDTEHKRLLKGIHLLSSIG